MIIVFISGYCSPAHCGWCPACGLCQEPAGAGSQTGTRPVWYHSTNAGTETGTAADIQHGQPNLNLCKN